MINPFWLARNVRRSWANRGSASDFARRLAWIYASKLPQCLRRPHWEISFQYPPPIGAVRLHVRDNDGADAFILSEVFDLDTYNFERVTSPATILDLGANVGYSVIYLSRRFPSASVACVEPIASNAAVLRKNFSLNAVQATVFEAAVDSEDGTLSMELAKLDYGHRVSRESVSGAYELANVRSICVPSLMKALGWDRIGLVKVDIEGHERTVLTQENSWLHRVDALCVEWHDEGGESALAELALQFGFFAPECCRGVWLLTRPTAAPSSAPPPPWRLSETVTWRAPEERTPSEPSRC